MLDTGHPMVKLHQFAGKWVTLEEDQAVKLTSQVEYYKSYPGSEKKLSHSLPRWENVSQLVNSGEKVTQWRLALRCHWHQKNKTSPLIDGSTKLPEVMKLPPSFCVHVSGCVVQKLLLSHDPVCVLHGVGPLGGTGAGWSSSCVCVCVWVGVCLSVCVAMCFSSLETTEVEV